MKYFTKVLTVSAFVLLLAGGSSCNQTNTCNTVSGMSSSYVNNTSTTVSWNNVSNATYTIQYRVVGTTAWSYTTSAVNSVTLSGLQANTTYEWQVKTDCVSFASAFTGSSTFNTAGNTLSNTAFAGTYNVNALSVDQNGTGTSSAYTMLVAANANYTDSIIITNYAGLGNNTRVSGVISLNTFNVNNITVDTSSVTYGVGRINGDTLTFSYVVNYPHGGVAVVSNVGIK